MFRKGTYYTWDRVWRKQGKTVIIVRALYGLASSGASFRNHLAASMCHFGYKSCLADPDLWHKPEVREEDKFKYYSMCYSMLMIAFASIPQLMKADICLSIAPMINKKGVRKTCSCKQVQSKLKHIKQQFQSAHDWATHTGQGIEEDDPDSFHAAVEKGCQYYFDLLDIFSDHASVQPQVSLDGMATSKAMPIHTLRLASSRDDRRKVTRFLCTSRLRSTIVETRAQRARHAPPALPPQGNMDQGQAAPQPQQAAPPAQPAAAAAPPVLPAPPPPLPVPPAPPAFTLGPGRSHAVLHFDNPKTRATATKLYNKAIAPLEAKFNGETDNLAVFLASVRDRARRFNWHRLITVLIDDGTTRNLLTHYGKVSLNNMRAHTATYVSMLTRDVQDNDMFYYFLADLLMNEFRTTVLLYANIYMVTNVPVASSLLKQIIILTRVDNPASTMQIREMLIESKWKLLLLKGNITEFNQWVQTRWDIFMPRNRMRLISSTTCGKPTRQPQM